MNLILELILIVVSGFFVKYTDFLTDVKRDSKYIAAIVYGSTLGILSTVDARVATITAAIMLANFINKKFDDAAFFIALLPMATAILIIGFAGLLILPFVIFLASTAVDEIMHERKWQNKVIWLLAEYRLFTWVFAGILSIVLADYFYIISIICFDLAYNLAAKFFTH